MEALEPVLKQKFWILLGIAVIMTFAGWWMATGAMAQQTTERLGKIKAAEDSVPKGEVPNESWTKRLAALNGVQDTSNLTTKVGLWKRQATKMTIPQGMDQAIEFRGNFTSKDREEFRVMYPDEVRRVWKMLNPMDIDGTGVVNFSYNNMLRVMNQKPWIVSAPKSEVIWDILEDLWLLEGLFQSIAEVNGGVEATRLEAVVHQIDKLELRGGGEKLPSGSAAGGSDGSISSMMAPSSMMGSGGGPGGGPAGSPMGGPGGGSAMTAISAEFDVREEFGEDGLGASSGGAGGGRSSASQMMMMGADSGSLGGLGGGIGGGGGGGTATTETVIKRYVSDDPSRPFKTRGFYLSVKMDHRRIPQLIAELTANDRSVWPVEILRVQMSRLHEDDMSSSSSRSMGGGMEETMTKGYNPVGIGLGNVGNAADDFSGFTSGASLNGPGAAQKSADALAAQAVLENTLRDPYMAQVTLCGVFTMFRKVDEPEVKPTTGVVPGAEETTATENKPADVGIGDDGAATTGDAVLDPAATATAGEEQPAGDAAGNPTDMADPVGDPSGEPGDSPDQPAAKTDEETTNDSEKTDENPKTDDDPK